MSLDRASLQALCHAHGFAHVRFATVGPTSHGDDYLAWLDAGKHGEMSFLRTLLHERIDPRSRMPGAKTAIALGVEHHHRRPPDPGGRTGMVARYAWGRDYHNLVGKRLDKLKRAIRATGIICYAGLDTAPVMERSWANDAGLGFTGKNAMQILPGRTSWMLLAVIFINVAVEPDRPLQRDHCGSCARCLPACPTNAFDGPRDLDARRCISYWTIEARTLAPPELRPGFGRWILGCDVCQEVCPHNHNPPDPDEDDFLPRNAWLDLDQLLHTPDQELRDRTIGTPLRRPGPVGLKRNALIALANLRDPGGLASIELGLQHAEPVVRAAAVWALRSLGESLPPGFSDDDPQVLAELRRA
jgi:epoxyqueuosine reductase